MWHIEEEPNGDKKVWISNKGRLIWTPPDNTEVVAFEERNYPDLNSGIEQGILYMGTEDVRQRRRF